MTVSLNFLSFYCRAMVTLRWATTPECTKSTRPERKQNDRSFSLSAFSRRLRFPLYLSLCLFLSLSFSLSLGFFVCSRFRHRSSSTSVRLRLTSDSSKKTFRFARRGLFPSFRSCTRHSNQLFSLSLSLSLSVSLSTHES